MKKVLFSLMILTGVSMIAPSCSDDFQDEEISLPQTPDYSTDGNDEGDPDGGDGPGNGPK